MEMRGAGFVMVVVGLKKVRVEGEKKEENGRLKWLLFKLLWRACPPSWRVRDREAMVQ